MLFRSHASHLSWKIGATSFVNVGFAGAAPASAGIMALATTVHAGVLRAQVGKLRMERDLLKRSLAFWVKESTQ